MGNCVCICDKEDKNGLFTLTKDNSIEKKTDYCRGENIKNHHGFTKHKKKKKKKKNVDYLTKRSHQQSHFPSKHWKSPGVLNVGERKKNPPKAKANHGGEYAQTKISIMSLI